MITTELNTLNDAAFEEDAPVSIAITPFQDYSAGYAYTATLADGSALPDWLVFDPATMTLAGQPPQDYNGSLAITVTASDGSTSAFDTFNLGITPANDAPLVLAAPQALAAKEDAAFSAQIDMAAIFADPDGDALAYAVSNLPAWLHYDAATSTLSGTPWPNAAGVVNVTLSATDASGASVETSLAIEVADNAGITASTNPKLKVVPTLFGTAGQDLLFGTAKDEVIDGGAGSDIISAGEGKDIITTGDGWDTVVLGPLSGKDLITDFKVGIDHLQLNGGMTIASLMEIDTNKDKVMDSTVVTFDTKDTVQLTGVVGVADAHALLVAEWMA